MTVGKSWAEPLLVHKDSGDRARRRKTVEELLEVVGFNPDFVNPVPARVLGRPAPAHRDRARARAQPPSDRLRRAGLGPRRLDPGADPQPPQGPSGSSSASRTCSSRTTSLSSVTMSDDIAVMNKGKIVEAGPAEQVYTHPRERVHEGVARRRPRARPASHARAQGRASQAQACARRVHLSRSLLRRFTLVAAGLVAPPSGGSAPRLRPARWGHQLRRHGREPRAGLWPRLDAAPPQLHGLGSDRREDLRRRRDGRQQREAARPVRAVRPETGPWVARSRRSPTSSARPRARALGSSLYVIGGNAPDAIRRSPGLRVRHPPRRRGGRCLRSRHPGRTSPRSGLGNNGSTRSAAWIRSTRCRPCTPTTSSRDRWSEVASLPEAIHAMAADGLPRARSGCSAGGSAARREHLAASGSTTRGWQPSGAPARRMPWPRWTCSGSCPSGTRSYAVLESKYFVYDAATRRWRSRAESQGPASRARCL